MTTLAPEITTQPRTDETEAGHTGRPTDHQPPAPPTSGGWGSPAGAPAAGTELLGRYPDYPSAQAAVDRLADGGFPVQHVTIVGEDLRVVESVTGRLTTGRAAAGGAVSGLWVGLALGLVLELLFPLTIVGLLLAIVVPAAVGAAFAGATHASLRGTRDFTSVPTIAAGTYAVLVAAPHAESARRTLLGQWIAAP